MMEEVICKERGDDGNATTTNKIEFPKLEEMQLDRLPMLSGFCRGIDEIEFPLLKKLHVEGLPQIKCPFPNRNTLSSDSDGNHNASVSIFPQKVAFPSLEVLELEFLDNLGGLAQNPLPVVYSCTLRKIYVVNCNELLHVVPSQLIPRLQNLEELTVEDCRSIEEVFELEGLDTNGEDSNMLSQLKSLKLIYLPKLNYASERDPIGFMCIPSLSTLHVHDCNSLRYLFSPAMMETIPQLQELEIRRCKMMSGIVAERNVEGKNSTHKIEFPQLKILRLYDLSNLVSFFPKVITNTVASNDSLQTPLQPLFNEKVAFPSLEKLELGGLPKMNDVWCSQHLTGSFHKLNLLHVSNCGCLRNLFSPFMARFLVYLQELKIENCLTLEEVVVKEEDEVRCTGKICKAMFPQLNHLELRDLPKLGRFSHITNEWELPIVGYSYSHNCPEMKTSVPGFLQSSNIHLGSEEEWAQMDDLNSTLQHFSEKKWLGKKKEEQDEEEKRKNKANMLTLGDKNGASMEKMKRSMEQEFERSPTHV